MELTQEDKNKSVQVFPFGLKGSTRLEIYVCDAHLSSIYVWKNLQTSPLTYSTLNVMER